MCKQKVQARLALEVTGGAQDRRISKELRVVTGHRLAAFGVNINCGVAQTL